MPLPRLGLVILFVSACVHDTTHDPVLAAPLPTHYAAPSPTAGDATEAGTADAAPATRPGEAWWLGYADPTLHQLIGQALRTNYTLRQRFAAIQQAEALRRQASALRWPTANVQANLSRSRSVGFFGANTSDRFDLSLPLSYEVDLFARRAGDARAAADEVVASELDMQAAAISLSAEVAEAWYDVVDARAEIQTLEQQVETNETYLELTRLRFQQGLASAVDVHQQRQQTAASRARLELAAGTLQVAGQQLGVLVGEPAGSFDADALGGEMVAMPELGEAPEAGVPGELVQNRPDILAARRRIEAADRRVGGIITERLPSLTVQFSPGWQWFRTDADLPDNTVSGFTYTAGANLNVPLFDGMLAAGRVDAQRATLQQQIEQLGDLVLRALVEVESALVLERQQRRNLELVRTQLAIAGDTLTSSRDRYRAGLSDFLPVLTAIQSQQSTELQLLDANRALVSQRIQLHRALGGTWPSALEPPEPTSIADGDAESER
ncbi:MAG: TolC family protein [Myxococcota bacterium]